MVPTEGKKLRHFGHDGYPLVNITKNYGKSSFLMGKLTINGNVQ